MGWSWGTSTGGAEGKAEDNLIPLSQNLPAAAGNWEALGCHKWDRKHPWESTSSHPSRCWVSVETGCEGSLRPVEHQKQGGEGKDFLSTNTGIAPRPCCCPTPSPSGKGGALGREVYCAGLQLYQQAQLFQGCSPGAPALSAGSAFPARQCQEDLPPLPHLPWHCSLTDGMFSLCPGVKWGSILA